MEVLQSDMASLMSSKKSSASLMDVVGADVNSSYDRPMQYQIFSDTYHISAGGQQVGPNFNIQIQIRDDNALQYLKKSGIAFDFVGDGFVHNAAALFSGLELSIGNVVVSTPFQHYYVQQKITKMGKKKLEPYAYGLGMKIGDIPLPVAWRVNAGALDTIPVVQTHAGAANPVVYTGVNAAIANYYNLQHRQLGDHFLQRLEINQAGDARFKLFVPFNFIFPCIDELQDDGCVFTGYGQSIKMNIRTNLPSECLAPYYNTANFTYQLSNMVLVKCFSKLDQPRADLVLKSNVVMPICKYVHWQTLVQSTTINAIYSVSKDDLVQGLWFAFHTTVNGAAVAEATNIQANLTNNVACQFKQSLNYFPQVCIQQVDIHVGGEPIIINMQQLQLLHLIPDVFGDDRETALNPTIRATKYAYHIDLRRYAKDLFGSSAKQTTTIQVQITLKDGPGSRTLFQQQADWNAAGAEYANFRMYSYLETLSFMELKNGVYTSK